MIVVLTLLSIGSPDGGPLPADSGPASAVADGGVARAEPRRKDRFRIVYDVRLVPNERLAKVEIQLENRGRIARVELTATPGQHLDFSGDGLVDVKESGLVTWSPPTEQGVLRFSTRIEHTRNDQSYDARCASEWALFRGDDLIPRIKARRKKDASGRAELRFTLPKGWDVETPYKRKKGAPDVFVLPTSDRAFARPTGWIMAGRIRSSSERIGDVDVTVAAPETRGLHRQEILSFLRWTMPEVVKLFGRLPPRLLIVGAGDPMWRGGLSAPASLFLHRDRPLVEDDGSSPLLHELVHVASEAQASEDGDWFVEGLAELYSIELLYRAGGLTDARRKEALAAQIKRAKKAGTLTSGPANGAMTGRAVQVLANLDREIRAATSNTKSLDDVLRQISGREDALSTDQFRLSVEGVAGRSFAAFFAEEISKQPSPSKAP
ncbi:MAG: hypothetical protein HY791_31765 [Deltaproteobacteria bacterium]|nr:hypothetical protein [Deltaproteobacteria bacterium]